MLPQRDSGVVDSRLKVYRVNKLRIVDTSVFPIIPDQHTQAAKTCLRRRQRISSRPIVVFDTLKILEAVASVISRSTDVLAIQ